jgi:hypothetical protein
VEAIGNNMFKTLFPNKAELQRMVEWGVVQSKFQNAKLKIEEKMIYNKAVKVLPKVWVQFNGLPKELCDFLIIWAVGSILGITKNVDMVFTRKHEICRLQVLVLDPNLIPQFVEVVIGESLYTLQSGWRRTLRTMNPNLWIWMTTRMVGMKKKKRQMLAKKGETYTNQLKARIMAQELERVAQKILVRIIMVQRGMCSTSKHSRSSTIKIKSDLLSQRKLIKFLFLC